MAIIPDWTLFLQIANFIVLILVLNAVLYKPIRAILIERQKTINNFEKDIQTLRGDVADRDQTFQAKISEAKSKGLGEKEAMKEAAEAEEKRLIAELQEKAQADLEAVRATIAKEAEAARGQLNKQAEAFSGAIAEKILGRSV
jgi:F-type H+-transporting ATPase subunit b